MKYWPWYLLLIAIPLLGAKTQGAFLTWGAIALCCCLYTLLQRSSSLRAGTAIGLLIGLLIAAEIFSMDPGTSLFQTLQLSLFVLLWICLSASADVWENEKVMWRCFSIAALITIALTSYQIGTNRTPVGFLPVNPNFNAAWMAAFAAAFFAREMTDSRLSDLEHTTQRMIIAATSLLLAIGHSRSGFVALAGSVLYILSPSLSWKKTALAAIAVVALMAVFPIHASVYFSRGVNAYRPQIWRAALEGIRDHPLTGYGLGNFEMAYQKHAFPVKEDAVRYARTTEFAHNEFLQVASELGLPAAGLVIFGVGYILCSSRKLSPAKAGFLAMALTALFNPVWHVPFLLYLTLLWAAWVEHGGQENRPPRVAPLLKRSCLVLTSLIGVFFGWLGLRHRWEARDAWGTVIRWNSLDGAAWFSWAWQQNDPKLRKQGLMEAVRQSPHQLYYHEAYAAALENSLRQEDLPLAWREYETALRESPRRALDALALGRLCYREKDPGRALIWFQKALDWEPNYWEADLWIARSLYWLERKSDAVNVLKNLLQRRTYFVQHPKELLLGESAYEQRILSYNNHVVEEELQQFLSR